MSDTEFNQMSAFMLIHVPTHVHFVIDGMCCNGSPVPPRYKYTTKALWVEIPTSAVADVVSQGLVLLEAIHAAQHLLLASLAVFVSCDPGDVGTEHASCCERG